MAKTSSAVTVQSSLLMQMATPDQPMEVKPSLPFIGFQSKKSDRFAEVKAAIPGIGEGQPYVFDGKTYLRVDSIGILDGALHYWAIFDNEMNFTEVSMTKKDTTPWKESVLAITLAFSGDRCIPSITTFRATKVTVCTDLFRAVERWSDADACKAVGPIGAKLAELPPYLRVAGEVELTTKTSAQGFAYQKGRARCRLLNDTEFAALAKLSAGDPALLQEVSEAFNGRKKLITEKAG